MSDPQKTHEEKLRKLDSLVRDVGIAMFTSADAQTGLLHSRPMAVQGGLDSNTLYFFAYQDSAKLDEVRQDHHVNCAFADPGKKHFVSITGTAGVTTDRAKMNEKWTPSLKAWFPKGLDTPGICLIKVLVNEAQYWDAPNQTLLHLYGVAKAALTGEAVQAAGENEKLKL